MCGEEKVKAQVMDAWSREHCKRNKFVAAAQHVKKLPVNFVLAARTKIKQLSQQHAGWLLLLHNQLLSYVFVCWCACVPYGWVGWNTYVCVVQQQRNKMRPRGTLKMVSCLLSRVLRHKRLIYAATRRVDLTTHTKVDIFICCTHAHRKKNQHGEITAEHFCNRNNLRAHIFFYF